MSRSLLRIVVSSMWMIPCSAVAMLVRLNVLDCAHALHLKTGIDPRILLQPENWNRHCPSQKQPGFQRRHCVDEYAAERVVRIRDKSDHFSCKSHTLEKGIVNCVQNARGSEASTWLFSRAFCLSFPAILASAEHGRKLAYYRIIENIDRRFLRMICSLLFGLG